MYFATYVLGAAKVDKTTDSNRCKAMFADNVRLFMSWWKKMLRLFLHLQ